MYPTVFDFSELEVEISKLKRIPYSSFLNIEFFPTGSKFWCIDERHEYALSPAHAYIVMSR